MRRRSAAKKSRALGCASRAIPGSIGLWTGASGYARGVPLHHRAPSTQKAAPFALPAWQERPFVCAFRHIKSPGQSIAEQEQCVTRSYTFRYWPLLALGLTCVYLAVVSMLLCPRVSCTSVI